MSYILDALKKSEQERKKGEVPGLNSFDNSPPPPRSTNRSLLFLLAGILIVAIAGVNLWALFRQAPVPDARDTSMTTTDTPAEVAAQTTNADKSAPLPQPPIDAITPTDTVKAEKQQTPPEIRQDMQTALAKAEQTPAIVVVEPEKPTMEAAATSEEQDIEATDETGDGSDFESGDLPFEEPEEDNKKVTIAYADLPSNIRDALPELSIAAHYYSNRPSARMASINGRIVRQGEKIGDGLVLEEIIEDGVIFTFNRYRFILKVFNP